MSVAEKLNRRWITCDIGKLSFFTMQKRLLQIENSQKLQQNKSKKEKHGKQATTFLTAKLGMYDLEKTFDLEWESYKQFVSGLFEIESGVTNINGISFDGTKRGYPVKIFDYIRFKNSAIDEQYLDSLSQFLSGKGIGRIYLIVPATRVMFIADYEEINDIRYYFLKVPYEMIEELHKKPFQKIRQPQSKNNVNDIDEMIGFQFVYPPEVKTSYKKYKNTLKINVEEFKSHYLQNDNGEVYLNFETLSAIFIDLAYNGESFKMDKVYFANEVLQIDKENNEWIFKPISISLSKISGKIMVIYTDIFGNDFSEIFNVEGE